MAASAQNKPEVISDLAEIRANAAIVEAQFQRLRWDTAPAFESWKREVAETRSRGWAVDTGNYIAGVTVAAAPVRKDGQPPSHALVAIGVGAAMRDGLAALRRDLVAASRSLSARLGSESRITTTPSGRSQMRDKPHFSTDKLRDPEGFTRE